MTASETQKMHADMNVKRIIAIFVMAVFVVSLVSDEALAQQRDLVPVPGGGQAGGTFVVQNGQSTYISPSSTYSFTYDHSANPPPPPASGGSSSSSSSSGGNTVETKKEIKIHPKNDGKRGGGATTIAPQRSTTRSTSTNSAGGGGPPDTPASPSSTLATTTHSLESLNFRIGQLRTLREQSQNVDNQAYFDSEIMMAENRRYQLLSSMSLSLQDPSLTLNSITNEQREILLNHIRNAQAASSAITSSNSRLIEINNQLRKDFNWEITNYDPTTQKIYS